MRRYVRSLAPNIHPPRWVVSLALNRFLDQDTYLLATQQSITLSNELRDMAEQASQEQPHTSSQTPPAEAQSADKHQTAAEEGAAAAAPMARRSWYCHRSPTDNILVASGKWMDKAVPFMPNRYQGLLTSGLQGTLLVCIDTISWYGNPTTLQAWVHKVDVCQMLSNSAIAVVCHC